MHADFEYHKATVNGETVVLIVDLDLGNRSVTNDAEHVLQTILDGDPDLASHKIYYRDSEGIWDRMSPIIRDGQVTNTYFQPGPRGAAAEAVDAVWFEVQTTPVPE